MTHLKTDGTWTMELVRSGKVGCRIVDARCYRSWRGIVHRMTKQFEHAQWRSQKLVEKRLAVYDDMVPAFNDLLCYFTYVGSWRDLNPPTVVSLHIRFILDSFAPTAIDPVGSRAVS